MGEHQTGYAVELNSETDFVAKTSVGDIHIASWG